MPRIHALIPAAGRSVRFGGTTVKQYTHLLGKPVLGHSIDAVRRSKAVLSVTVALADDDGIFEELMRPSYPAVRTAVGGATRAQTVMNGVDQILEQDPSCEWVLVHDAARPCLGPDELSRLIEQGVGADDGAILAVPVRDTLKQADAAGRIERTVDRSLLWAAQTPQMFRLDDLVARELFREDLLFRINVFPLNCPSLAQRPEDIPIIVQNFIDQNGNRGGKAIMGLTAEAMETIYAYDWPGNVRELRNAIEYAFVLCPGGWIDKEHLPPKVSGFAQKNSTGNRTRRSSWKNERDNLLKALRQANGNQSEAAKLMGVSRVTIWKRIKKYGIDLNTDLAE